ncbi:MAG: winged helix-turn-helix domain-containing protein [Novosphingobium sp.]|uniref:response regulator transcription factor n=1 Tax=Novosphingobium sp. TaxID=1874826 RepID=UPI001D742314|nr:response regulator transcription factor [Novosphingobium sp.]MCB2057175.1 winged helix-turn-helix domain-containing protein [Novosphingobium sp.]MCP5386483.1 winged helix-turn-helix domain-containing protein [Novosphingobium sp.]
MNNTVSLLITSPHPGLVSDIASKRPGWRILSLGDVPPSSRLEGKVWGFIDWLGQSMSGLEMCRRLRESEATRGAHLTMVLEEPSSEAKRRALLAGADDYMVGPLDVTRLLERIESLGGARPSGRQLLVNGPVSLDPAAHQVRVNGRVVTIRPNEFRLLAHFIEHPDQVFSRAALIERLGKDGETIDERTVDVWVGRLRRALIAEGAPDPLRTVRSLGYVMDSIEA